MKIKRSKFDIVLNLLCLLMLIATSIFLVILWPEIPQKVPMHNDLAGNVDRWGAKSEIMILPVMAWFVYLFITAIEKFPQSWNTGVRVTEENKERVYLILSHLISSSKFIISGVFSYLTLQTALGFSLSPWFTPVLLTVIFGDLFYWLWRLLKSK